LSSARRKKKEDKCIKMGTISRAGNWIDERMEEGGGRGIGWNAALTD
jgi:hypothetical protein